MARAVILLSGVTSPSKVAALLANRYTNQKLICQTEGQVKRCQLIAAMEERIAHAGEVREGRKIQPLQPRAAAEKPVACASEV